MEKIKLKEGEVKGSYFTDEYEEMNYTQCMIKTQEYLNSLTPITLTVEEAKECGGIIPKKATALADLCFSMSDYTRITIPTTIKELPYRCFFSSSQLKSITIPTSITKLDDYCFEYCSFVCE